MPFVQTGNSRLAFPWVHIALKKVEGFVHKELLKIHLDKEKILLDKTPWYVYDLSFATGLNSLAGISRKRFCGNFFVWLGFLCCLYLLFKVRSILTCSSEDFND